MLNLNEILIRELIRELIEEYQSKLIHPDFIKAPNAKKTEINKQEYGRQGMGKIIPVPNSTTYTLQHKSNPQINKQPNGKLTTITQRFENWVSDKNINMFKTISDIEKEYRKIENPNTSQERAELIRAIKEKWNFWKRYH